MPLLKPHGLGVLAPCCPRCDRCLLSLRPATVAAGGGRLRPIGLCPSHGLSFEVCVAARGRKSRAYSAAGANDMLSPPACCAPGQASAPCLLQLLAPKHSCSVHSWRPVLPNAFPICTKIEATAPDRWPRGDVTSWRIPYSGLLGNSESCQGVGSPWGFPYVKQYLRHYNICGTTCGTLG